jgi:hypothetical protein
VTPRLRHPLGLATLLLGPMVLANLVTFVWPMLNLASYSFRAGTAGGALGEGLTLSTWSDISPAIRSTRSWSGCRCGFRC